MIFFSGLSVAPADLEIALQTKVVLTSPRSICFCLPSSGIKGVYQHTWLKDHSQAPCGCWELNLGPYAPLDNKGFDITEDPKYAKLKEIYLNKQKANEGQPETEVDTNAE